MRALMRDASWRRCATPVPARATCDVRLETSGQVRGTRRVTIPPATSVEVPFEARRQARSTSRSTTPTGTLPTTSATRVERDADAATRADRERRGRAAATGSICRARCIAGGDEGPDFDVRTVQGSDFVAMSGAQLHDQASSSCCRPTASIVAFATRCVRFSTRGGGLFVAAADDLDASVLSTVLDWTPPLKPRERAARGVLAATDLRHPVFKPFDAVAANLGQVSFERAWQIDPRATGRSSRNIPMGRRRCSSGQPARAGSCCSRLISTGDGTISRSIRFTCRSSRRWPDILGRARPPRRRCSWPTFLRVFPPSQVSRRSADERWQ